MMPQAIDTLRIGHKYIIINYGEKILFELMAIKNHHDYIAKDLATLEIFNLRTVLQYGLGKDYDLYEVEDL